MTIEARFELEYPSFRLDFEAVLPGRGVTALFGPSGCGKTTALRCVAGLARPRRGRLVVNGEVWQDEQRFLPTHRRALGYVFQESSLFDHLDVRRNLEYGRSRVKKSGQSASLDHLVELLGLTHLLPRMPAGLSGGERQRVAIARALLTSPRLLLMDEPLTALDVARKAEFLPYLERLHAELDIPVLYVSHAPDEVARLADHIVVMEAGKALATGELADVLARLDLPIRLGEEAGIVLSATIAERDAAWSLARVEFPGGALWVRDSGHASGEQVRVRVLARDVSIAREPAHGTSIMNSLPAQVEALGDDTHPALALVRLRVNGTAIVARITRRSAHALALEPGAQVWAQIKAAAVIA